MEILILSNGNIIEKNKLNTKLDNVICRITNKRNIEDIDEVEIINIHKDIIIKSKDMITLRIPILENGEKIIINGVLDKKIFSLYYDNHNLIEFLKDKISLHNELDKNMICLLVFQYFSYQYNEELLKLEERLDNLFQEALEDGEIDNKEILEIKKKIAKIKRFITYYKSMITYLDDEFSHLDLYDKALLVLDNTLGLIENVESSVYSCIDIYNSELSNKMNKTMQLLTIITVLSLPITIISGVFGMNFNSMPFLSNQYGFIGAIIFTILIIILELIYFKRKKYL